MSSSSRLSGGWVVGVAVLLVVSMVPAVGAVQVDVSGSSPVDVGAVTGLEGVDGSQVVVPVVDPPVRESVDEPSRRRVAGRVAPVVVPVWSENPEAERLGVAAGSESRVWVSGEPGELVFSEVPVRVVLGAAAFERAVVSVRAEVLDVKDGGLVSPFGLAIGLEFWAGSERLVPSGPVRIEVSYEDVGLLSGGDAAGRVRLVAFPDCDRVKGLECGDVRLLGSVNDPTARTVSAVVDPAWLGSGVLALGSGPSGPSTDFTSAPMSGVGSYQVGLFSGAAELSYPIELPAPAAGPAPSVVLSYSSGAVDGLHSSTNNQPGWVGLGWVYEPGSITRLLKTCDDTENLCLAGDEYSISLNGVSERLVQDTVDDDLFRVRSDPGWLVERQWGAASHPDTEGEFWVVTSPDGTVFRFGGEVDPDTAADLDSAWFTTVEDPVVCAGGTFGLCTKVWRWNLDRIEDLNGNAVSFDYATEVGFYDAEGDNSVFYRKGYIRAGHVGEIYYTQRAWNQTNARVTFGAEDRCTPGSSCVWPTDYLDTPGDLECAATGTCSQQSPTFWSKYRLGSIQTSVWNSSSSSWTPTGYWQLDHTFPTPPLDSDGDASEPKLWLSEITRLYPDGTGTGLPPTVYGPVMLDNRLNHPSGVAAMTMPRVGQVTTPLGGAIEFSYGQSHPCAPNTVYDYSDHHLDCFPGYDPYTGSGGWVAWNKWKIDEYSEEGSFGNPAVVTDYAYGPPAWHHEQSPVKPASLQSWNDFRGHPWVEVTGADGITSELTFYQGMDGDKTASGGTKSVNITLSDSTTRADANWLTGRAAEARVLEGTTKLSRVVTEYGAQSTAGSGTYGAYLVNPTQVTDTSYGTTDKTSRVDYSWDVYGNQTGAVLHGDLDTTADDRVISRSFKTNLGLWLVDRPAFEKLWAGTTPGVGSVKAATVFGYDSDATIYLTGTPTKGNLTTLRSYLTPTTFVDEDYVYDYWGRTTSVTDAESNTSSFTYHGIFGSLFTATNPASHVTSYGYDSQARLVTVTDPNSHVTTVGYDNYGRVTEVWEPTEPTSGTPTRSYAYGLAGSPAWTRTRQLTDIGTVDSYTYVDGLGRPLQTQAKTATGRSLVSTQTDTMGRTLYVSHPYGVSGAPGAGLVAPVWTTVPTYTKTLYDPLGQPERTDLMSAGVSQAHTTTTQDGWVTKQIDANGNRTDQQRDGFGNLTQVTEYNGTTVYATTSYSYNLQNNLVSVTDADSNVTSIGYNLLGWKTSMSDPDMGSWAYSYDDTGQLISQTDGKNQTLWFGLDDLGRVTERRQTNASGTLLAEYGYDGSGQKGLLSWSKSYTPEGTVQVTNTAYDASDRVTDRKWVIPGTGGGTYALGWDYDPADRIVSVTYPGNNTGGLGETVTTGFNSAAQPVSLLSDTSESYVISTVYHPDGRPIDQLLAAGAVTRFTDMDPTTQRVDEWRAGTGTAIANLADLGYDYDPAGNITTSTDGANGGQRQCYFYDHRQRLIWAYTGTEAGAKPVCYYRDTTRGDAPYELAYTYNPIGNLTQTAHNYPTAPTETYTYGTGTAGPHAVTAIGSNTYSYDNNGDLTSRTVDSVTDTLTFDYDRRLRQVSGGGDTTTMIYDADGNRVARTDPDGRSVYVGDWYETRTDTTTEATSHYWANGTRIASRTANQPTLYLTTDPQSSIVATFARTDGVWANFSTNPGWNNQLVGDFNGDGKDDIANYHPASRGWWVSKSTGSSFTTGRWVTLPTGSWVTHLAGDFTGDGKTDLAHFSDSDGTWWVSKSTGSSFTTSVWADFSTTVGWGPQLVGDFNGDGKDDIANYHAGSRRWWVSKSTGSSFTTGLWDTLPTGNWINHVAGDFTGDGKSDLAHFRESDGTWWVSKSTGSGFTTTLWADFSSGSGWAAHPVGDYNGDGKDDIGNFHPSNGTWWISKSTGTSFTTTLWADFSTASGWISQMAADVNGDGKTDLLNHHPSNGSWWTSVSSGSGLTTHRSNLTATGDVRLPGDFNGDNKGDLATFEDADGSWWTNTTLATAAYQTDQQYYHPYGGIRATDNPDTDLAYTGQRLDQSTGLMYYNARYYNPTTRRFISPDTIIPNPTNPQTLNRYTYTTNNPTNHTDPTGHVGELVITPVGMDNIGLTPDQLPAYTASLQHPPTQYQSIGASVAGAASQLWDSVEGGAIEAGHRVAVYGEYSWDNLVRRVSNPGQTATDIGSGSFLLEDLAAMYAIVAAGGELYAQGPHCGSEMSCITEVNAPKDAITLGHTVLFDSSTPLELLVEHEYQHVVDIESVGGFPFYFSYLRESAIRWVTGWGDPYLHLRWERRALNAEQGTRPSTAKWWLPWVLP